MTGAALIWDGRKAVTTFGTYQIMPDEAADEGGYWIYQLDGEESEKHYFTEVDAKQAVEADFTHRCSESSAGQGIKA